MPVAVLMAVGPGDAEVARADDVIDSILFHEPSVDVVLLVDDAPTDRDLLGDLTRPGRPLAVTANPRDGRGHGLWGGLAAGMLHGYGWLQRAAHPDVVMKLDTDALVIAPFAQRVSAALADPQIGMIGTCRHRCDGTPRQLDNWDFVVKRRRPPVRPFRVGNSREGRLRLRHTLWGSPAVIRRRIAAARRNGYRYGVHCLGGAYAVPGTFLDRMAERGWYDDWPAWVELDIGEDVCIAIYVEALGLQQADANAVGEVFGVEYLELPLPPQQLVDAGYAVIHSVKDQDGWDEQAIRAFFRGRRSEHDGSVPDRGDDHHEALGQVGHEREGDGGQASTGTPS